ncbi:KEOPS complex subunit Pcc1 [Halococcoides cellulosivorans]|uniref:Rpo operon protein n=1 Tax=Halococcoides cellulosivorans TaxID=1679096 RepID=A0A2R4WZ19_9EURY|nr:KEOPS complex subunit Pcc1 [Halococcoides cellulosivorans]AWB26781.1 rpo operon protein [Halococcoides cellulosivorans]
MTDSAVVRVEYDDADRARRVERALAPEIDAIDADRTAAILDRDGATLEISIEATDPVALRAGANSWLGLLEVAERVAVD